MDIILVPGFWLDASSWDEVIPALEDAGHTVHALTLPGLESADAPRANIGLRTHIDAVIRTVDSLDGKVILVGHSGGGAIIHEVGTVRMGDDPQTSPLNKFCQAHEVKNLFVADAAPFVSNADKNPTHTIIALAWRTAEYLAEEMRKGNV